MTNYQENFNSSWKSEQVFGRTDPIYTYGNTRRTVSLGFDVPASSEQEAFENMGRLQKLAQFSYPVYYDYGSYLDGHKMHNYVMGQAPLVRIKVMNLVQKDHLPREDIFGDDPMGAKLKRSRLYGGYGHNTSPDAEQGLLASINNITFNTDFQNHAIFERGPNVVMPQNFEVSVDFNVIHEKTTGFSEFGDPLNPGMPYGITLKKPTPAEGSANYEERLQLERDRQAAEDIAASRFRGALGGRRADRAIARYERKKEKGKANSFDEALASEAKDYKEGTGQ